MSFQWFLLCYNVSGFCILAVTGHTVLLGNNNLSTISVILMAIVSQIGLDCVGYCVQLVH